MKRTAALIGQRVRAARKLRGWSQAQLARVSQVDPATIHRIERGTSRGHQGTLEKIARALRVDVASLDGTQPHKTPAAEPPMFIRELADNPDEWPPKIPTAVCLMLTHRAYLNPIDIDEAWMLCARYRYEGVVAPDELELELLAHRALHRGDPEATKRLLAELVKRQGATRPGRTTQPSGSAS